MAVAETMSLLQGIINTCGLNILEQTKGPCSPILSQTACDADLKESTKHSLTPLPKTEEWSTFWVHISTCLSVSFSFLLERVIVSTICPMEAQK